MNAPLPFQTGPSVTGRTYQLETVVGEGVYGRVYKAFDAVTPEIPVAVKLPKKDSPHVNIIALSMVRTMREAGFLQMTQHLNVVKYLDHGAEPQSPYVVMEFVPQTLASVPLTQEVIEDYLQQIPTILRVLKEYNVAHCDLKESNLGYVNGTIKLADFGLSIPFEHPVTYPCRNHPAYHAPEFRQFNWVTNTADTYSAGRVLEHLLTGEYASSGTAAVAAITRIQGITPPKSFQKLLCRMTSRDHLRRPTPAALEKLAALALNDLQRRDYFFQHEISSRPKLHFFGSASAS